MAGILKNLQCSLINSALSPFTINNTTNLEFPMAPMITSKLTNTPNLKIRITLFIDSSINIK